LEILCDLGIETFRNEKTATSQKSCKEKSALHIKKSAPHMKPCNKESLAQIKREVWQESQHECSNCKSTFALEMDHLHPRAKGGGNTKDNLRILCRACNQRAAIREFGQLKMDLYLN
jgi:5-methylcytosine-specific restriction endonuclease McrA